MAQEGKAPDDPGPGLDQARVPGDGLSVGREGVAWAARLFQGRPVAEVEPSDPPPELLPLFLFLGPVHHQEEFPQVPGRFGKVVKFLLGPGHALQAPPVPGGEGQDLLQVENGPVGPFLGQQVLSQREPGLEPVVLEDLQGLRVEPFRLGGTAHLPETIPKCHPGVQVGRIRFQDLLEPAGRLLPVSPQVLVDPLDVSVHGGLPFQVPHDPPEPEPDQDRRQNPQAHQDHLQKKRIPEDLLEKVSSCWKGRRVHGHPESCVSMGKRFCPAGPSRPSPTFPPGKKNRGEGSFPEPIPPSGPPAGENSSLPRRPLWAGETGE